MNGAKVAVKRVNVPSIVQLKLTNGIDSHREQGYANGQW